MRVRVETVDGVFEMEPGTEFTFGRSSSCTFCVDETDRNISRKAGVIAFSGAHWMLTNTSRNRTIHLIDQMSGNAFDLLPGHVHVICEGRLAVSLHGINRAVFQLTVVGGEAEPLCDDSAMGTTSATLGPPVLSPRQRVDLSAVFGPYLEPDGRAAPRPRTYSEAAALLGDTPKALEHRIFHFRTQLLRSGYPRMDMHELAIFLIGSQSLTPPVYNDTEG